MRVWIRFPIGSVSSSMVTRAGTASSVLTPCTHDAGGDLAVKDSNQQLRRDAVQSCLRVSTEVENGGTEWSTESGETPGAQAQPKSWVKRGPRRAPGPLRGCCGQRSELIACEDARLLSVGDCALDAVTSTYCAVQGRLDSNGDTLLLRGWPSRTGSFPESRETAKLERWTCT